MSLKVKTNNFVKGYIIIISCLFLILTVFIFSKNFKQTNIQQEVTCQIKPIREKDYEELSPDGSKKAIRYKLYYNPDLFSNNYTTYLDNNVIIAVTNNVENTEREYYIFIGDEKTGEPHWISNNYVFFTSYCGSSCQHLTLLDTRTGQKWSAVLSFSSNKDGVPITYFHDWFKNDFKFNGSIQKIYGKMESNKSYLVFDMENENGVEIGEKRFLFTGGSLVLKR